jgi:hypothetical protein
MHEQDECERQLFDHAQLLHNLSADKAATNLSVSLLQNKYKYTSCTYGYYDKRKSTPTCIVQHLKVHRIVSSFICKNRDVIVEAREASNTLLLLLFFLCP